MVRFIGVRVALCLVLIVLAGLAPSVKPALAAEETGVALAPAASQGPALGSLSAGGEHSCAVRPDGGVVCWGSDRYGQSTPPAGTFTQVEASVLFTCGVRTNGTLACWGRNDAGESTPPAGTFTQVAAGNAHTCGLRSDGTVACWGSNYHGQSTPPAGRFTQIAVGGIHTCGLKTNGALACWGNNSDGQSTPPGGTFTQVSAGGSHTCGVNTNGAVACWGANDYNKGTPPGGTFTQVAAGEAHTCGLRTDGTVACWGDNTFGQRTLPSGTFTKVAAGHFHSCGLRTDGTLACWGNKSDGQSTPPGGNFGRPLVSAGGMFTCQIQPGGAAACWGVDKYGQSSPPGGTFTQVAAGEEHTCGLRTNGTLACWGNNDFNKSQPPPGTFKQVTAGMHHACGLKSDGTPACWGSDDYGQRTPPPGTFIRLSAGVYHSCGLRSDGTLACWGDNSYGEASPPGGAFLQVVAGWWHSCGLRTDGTAACWGRNDAGQSAPPGGTFTQVSAGGLHSCGVRTNGTLACWGDNTYGQRTPPVGTFTQVAAGSYHNCGTRTNGTLVCWGDNRDGAVAEVSFERHSFIAESLTSATIGVVLTASSVKPVTVKYATASGSATGGRDFNPKSGTLTFSPGQTRQSIAVPIVNDTEDEPDETFLMILSSPQNATLGLAWKHQVMIQDDDPQGSIRLSATGYKASEGGAAATITAQRIGGAGGAVSVGYRTVAGTARAGNDFTPTAGSLSWDNGDRADKSFVVTIADDALDEPSETFTVELGGFSGGALPAAPITATVTIGDNDPTPVVRFTSAASSALESGQFTVTVDLSATSSQVVTVQYSLTSGTALGNSDFRLSSGKLTFAPGQTRAGIILSVSNDAADEPDETFTVTLSSPQQAVLGAPSRHTFTILDDDDPPTVQFGKGSPEGSETTTPATFNVWLSQPSSRTVTVKYATANGGDPGGARSGSDYLARSGTLTFPPGQSFRTISVPIVNNREMEPDESFTVTLSNPVNATLGAKKEWNYVIHDEDTYGAIRLSAASYTVGEAGRSVTITAKRDGGAGGKVGASFFLERGTAAAGSDFGPASSGEFFWGIGDRADKTITIPIISDALDEADETFSVQFFESTIGGAALGSPSRATVTIRDDDPLPVVRFVAASSSRPEREGTMPVDVSLSAPSGRPVSVKVATSNGTAAAGIDFQAVTGNLTFEPGVVSKRITVPVADDPEDEADETFAVSLSGAANATLGTPARHTCSIVNDDPIRVVEFDHDGSSGAESTTPAVFAVTLSPASNRSVTVRYATANGSDPGGARSGNDYTARAGTLTFPPGETKAAIAVPIVNDGVQEPRENFTLTLSGAVNAVLGEETYHNHSILDDDTYGAIRLSAVRYSVSEAGPLATITAQRVGGTANPVYVTIWTQSGTAAPGSDYAATNGRLSWSSGDKTDKKFTVPITNDAFDEVDETFLVMIWGPANGAVLGSPDVATVTILDDDPLPAVRFATLSSSGLESAGAVIEVLLSAASSKTVTVKYATANGSAVAGSDYIKAENWLTFPPSLTRMTINLPVSDDGNLEPNETFSVTLSSPGNATLGTPARHVYTIVNNDVLRPPFASAEAQAAEAVRPTQAAANDFDGDGRSDIGVFDPTTGIWSLRLSTEGEVTGQLASAGVVPVTGDFDGDGRGDIGVFDPATGTWTLRASAEGDSTLQLDAGGAVPVTGDFDGDGRSDIGVFDPATGTWTLRSSAEGNSALQLGAAGAVPVTGDFDGDGRSDCGIFEGAAGLWTLRLSAARDVTLQLGAAGAVPVTGDFDGDGATDCGCYTPDTGVWEIALSTGTLRADTFGCPEAVPVVGDFDGDGRSDIGCYAPAQTAGAEGLSPTVGAWRILRSTDGLVEESLGGVGAVPIGGRR